jgi:CelD/BcsL family acetyltransferase involved in cellulose biosynthesis
MSSSIDALSPGGLTSRVLSFDEFLDLEHAWDELVLASAHPLPFLSHAWLRTWWNHFGAGQEFRALVVEDGNAVLAGVPLALRRVRQLGVSVTLGEIVGTGPVPTRGMGLADKVDLVVHAAAPAAALRIMDELTGLLERIDVLDLKGIEESSPLRSSLVDAADRPRRARTLDRSASPYLPLGQGWEAYLASRTGNFRKHLRKYWRELAKLGEVEVARMEPGDDVDAWVADIVEVNALSWKATRGTNLFRHPRIRDFFRDLVCAMAPQGRLDLQRLRLGGTTAAYEFCFEFGRRLFSYNGSFRNDLAKPSPGTALTAEVIRSACERGITEYDMLRGEEGYKARWSDASRREVRILLPANRLRARQYTFWSVDVKDRLKRSARLRELDDRITGLFARIRHSRDAADGEGTSR